MSTFDDLVTTTDTEGKRLVVGQEICAATSPILHINVVSRLSKSWHFNQLKRNTEISLQCLTLGVAHSMSDKGKHTLKHRY